jgi:hypothetical protein
VREARNPRIEDAAEPPSAGQVWTSEFIIRMGAAIVVASGAAYLLGYVAQINAQLFTYIGPGDYVNAALIYLPVSIAMAMAAGVSMIMRHRSTKITGAFEQIWKTADGEWSVWFKRSLVWTTSIVCFFIAAKLMSVLRFGGSLDPLSGIFVSIALLFLVREMYAYAHRRYDFSIQNWETLVGAAYYLTTAFYIGYDPAPRIPAMILQSPRLKEDDPCARADFQTNRSLG